MVAPFQFKLVANEVVVVSALVHEVGVGAHLNHAALVQNDDLIGIFDGAEPVGNDHAGPPGEHPAQVLHDVALRC